MQLPGKDVGLWLLVVVQAVCAMFFIVQLIVSIFGLSSTGISWQMQEFLEISASLGLLLGAILGFRLVWIARSRQQAAEDALRAASGAFAKVVDEKFNRWALTNAERDVAWFAVKGFSTSEIAGLRGSSEGTVKAQCNAIYRKTGTTGRAQLLSVLVEDLLMAKEMG